MNAPVGFFRKMGTLPPGLRPEPLHTADGDLLDLSGMLGTLWRGRWALAIATLIGVLLGGLWTIYGAVPQYRATAVVVLEAEQEPVIDISSVLPGMTGDTSAVNTEVEVLRSRSLMAKVATTLGLETDPEFNPALHPPGFLSDVWRRALLALKLPLPDWVLKQPNSANSVVRQLQKHVAIVNIPDSLVFEIIVDTADPAKSVRIANSLAELYILGQIEMKFEATKQAKSWLSSRVSNLKSDLEKAESHAKAFATQSELISEEALLMLSRRLKETRTRIAEIHGLKTALLKTKSQRDRDELARITARLAVLESGEAELAERINRQSADLVTLEQLEREVEASRLIYEYFLNRLKETSVQQGVQKADSRILSNAVLPDHPASPQLKLILALAGAVGLMFGAALVLGKEARQNTFRTAEQLENATGHAVLGQIPRIKSRRRSGIINYLAKNPNSAAAEAVRNLRTSILLNDPGNPPKVILSTSSLSGEGKTTHSLALAQNIAAMGKNVLLVEGDIRKRVFKEYFRARGQPGMTAVLAGEIPFSDAIMRHATLGFDVLIGGETTANAADLFSSQEFEQFLSRARQRYDFVVIDTPPVLAVPDARVIGQLVDAIIYSVKWDETRRQQLTKGLRTLETVGLSITGLVLGQIDPKGARRYGYDESLGFRGYYTS